MKISGNTILITGGTSGIGKGFAEEFSLRNNKVIVCGRRENRLQEIKRYNENIEIITCDVTKAEQRELLIKTVTKKYPETNILINNAGIQLLADLTDVDLNKLNQEIETNLTAPVHLASLFIQHLRTRNESAIINISSGLAFVPLSFVPVYCATKAAIHSLSISLRYQLKDSLIKVFEIIPPSVDTELGHERRTSKSETHGGIPVDEFISESMKAIEQDIFEAPIEGAKNLYEKREAMFRVMNK
ncbi:MAG: SDR family NAD(P)-dependent oxidoreductase [Ignavibacteriaceae bacterium]